MCLFFAKAEDCESRTVDSLRSRGETLLARERDSKDMLALSAEVRLRPRALCGLGKNVRVKNLW